MSDLSFTSATELARLVRERAVSPVEIVDGCLDRIEKIDPSINAFVALVGDRAREEARRAEALVMRGGELPALLGVPIGIKDLNLTEGITTTFSSKAFANFVPEVDHSTVRRMRSAGMLVLGKTNTPEFGSVPVTESDLNGDCHNPWDPDKTPGGSSGGSGAAVAAGMVPVAQGTDGGGSVRIPASCCGLFGIKPARGRVSHSPSTGEAWSGLSTDGVLARTVQDGAALLDVMSGYETGDPYWAPSPARPFAAEVGRDPGNLRIAFSAIAPNGASPDPEVAAALADAAHLLEELGHQMEESAPDWVEPEAAGFYLKLTWFVNAAYYDFDDLSLLEPFNQVFAELGRETSSFDYIKARVRAERYTRKVVGFWNDFDLLLTPTVALPPPDVGWVMEPDDPWDKAARSGMFIPYTPIANITGQPAVNVPLYWSETGLPLGVQLIGRPADEATLIRVASQLEEARPWAERRPAMSYLDHL
ncbi:MAG: amidase [Actinobacteria bacterium]|nr:amidase [Actinomycetota bacterium]